MPDRSGALPTFLIIGAGKSGTTSLWSWLNQHPQIGMSAIKEPSFFSMDEVHARGADWYRRLFAAAADAPARGEASNSYSASETYPQTIDRIARLLEAPRFIYIVRHPRARTESDWMQRNTLVPTGFAEFLRGDPLHADKNHYLRTYDRYAARFGEASLLVLFHDDLVRAPEALLRRVCGFLGVDPDFAFDVAAAHGRTAEGRRFHFGLDRLRRLRAYTDLSLLLPEAVKARLRGALSRPVTVARPVWSAEDAAWFRDRYEAPSRAFLQRVGRDPGLWAWD
jgi:hypothetical protein